MPQAIHISPIDNVVVALHPIAKGTLVEVDGLSVTALEDIPQGHKMAVKPIKNGENVIKYGFPIGHATADAAPGSWMHTHNVHSSWEYLQNVIPAGYKEHQEMGVTIAAAKHYLNGKGAVRVHGGGFAGTAQAFVPVEMLADFKAHMEAILGEGRCHVLSIRPEGGAVL